MAGWIGGGIAHILGAVCAGVDRLMRRVLVAAIAVVIGLLWISHLPAPPAPRLPAPPRPAPALAPPADDPSRPLLLLPPHPVPPPRSL